MAIEVVDFPMKNGGSFHSYVKLPEGTCHTIHNSTVQEAVKGMALGVEASASALLVYSSR